jgi:chromosomal replication initiation ATPase DnaA
MAREQGGWLLLTARSAPSGWPLKLADLASRLRAAPSVHLGPPDDLLLRAVLVKLFADRQLNVDVTVLDYVCRRIERSLAAVAEFVQRLDREALEEGRAISRNLAGKVLADMAAGREEGGAEADS